jgi:hypothetical protein
MSTLVGTLAVDVTNGTATFKLDDAKSELDSFGKKAAETGERVSYSMRESRESIMAVSDMFGVHLPASITRTIAGLGPLGPALEMALPFAALALGATLLVQHLQKIAEEAQKLALSQANMGTTVQGVFNSLDDKLLEAGIKADELAGNHLAALQKRLEYIDHQSLHELVQQFDTVAAVAERTLGNITEHWYESKIGVIGVKDALENFKAQYAALLAQGKDTEAGNLLRGTLQSAIKVKELMEASQGGHGSTQTDLEAQDALVGALQAQVTIQQKLEDLKRKDDNYTKTQTAITVTEEAERQYRAVAEAAQRAADQEEKIRSDAAREDLSLARGDEQEQIKLTQQGSQARIAAIDEAIKKERSMYQTYTDYYKSLIAQRAQAVTAADNKEVADLEKKISAQDHYNQSILQEVEAKIKGAASSGETDLKDKASLGLISKRDEQQQLQQVYQQELQSLLTLYAREITAAAQHQQQMAALAATLPSGSDAQAAALRSAEAEQDRMNKLVAQGTQIQTQLNTAISQSQTQVQHLQSSWQDYFAKMKTETSELSVTVREQLQGSITQFMNGFSTAIAKSLVEGKSLGKEMRNVGKEILETMISTLVKWVEQWIVSHTIMAAVSSSTTAATLAAGKIAASQLAGANAVASYSLAPFPLDLGAPAFGASMAAAALAFEQGGIVPGQAGNGVPILAHAQEMVLPAPISQGLQSAINGGTFGGNAGDVHIHAPFAPKIQAFDADGIDKILAKHRQAFATHIKNELRRMHH